MPEYGLVGDSSLYCKKGKKVRRIGCQLQEQLETNDLWYHAVANAGVEDILQMLKDTRLTFGTLGISYFGNDVTEGRIRPEVPCFVHHAHSTDYLQQTSVWGAMNLPSSLPTLSFEWFHKA